jgi:4-hydroxy-tetrahydrodipicolinate synthase
MIKSQDLHGVIAAIVTPFKDNEDLDKKGLRILTRYLLDEGVHAIMAVGGNGEFPNLERQEKKEVIKAIAEEVKGEVPVVAGTAACSTRESLALMEDAKDAGADAAIMVPPYYFTLNGKALLLHFSALAQASILPVIVYNNPLYTGNPMDPNLLSELLSVENIIGLKQSSPDMGQLIESIRLAQSGSSICTGIDSQFFPALMIGARGIYSTAASIIPKQMRQIYDLWKKGNYEEARLLHVKIQQVNRFLEYDPGYVSPAKEALKIIGLPSGPVRRPMPELSEQEKEGLRESLKNIGVI